MSKTANIEDLKKRIEWLEENVVSLEKKVFTKKEYKKGELYLLAKEYTLTRSRISPAILQRVFSIDYEKAKELIDTFEKEGLVTEPDGARPRQVIYD